MPYLALERLFAARSGWTNLVDAGGSVIGTPPGGADESRGQAPVPRWARDWTACGPLMVEYRLIYTINDGGVYSGLPTGAVLSMARIADHPDEDTAVRYVIVMAACALRVAAALDCLPAPADAAQEN